MGLFWNSGKIILSETKVDKLRSILDNYQGGDYMAFGGFYKGEKKKPKKGVLEKKAEKMIGDWTPPQVEIIGKGKKKDW